MRDHPVDLLEHASWHPHILGEQGSIDGAVCCSGGLSSIVYGKNEHENSENETHFIWFDFCLFNLIPKPTYSLETDRVHKRINSCFNHWSISIILHISIFNDQNDRFFVATIPKFQWYSST